MMAAAADNGVGALLDLLDMAPATPASNLIPPEAATGAQAGAEGDPGQHAGSDADSAASRNARPQAEPSGKDFMGWLTQGVRSRKLIINDAKALVHTVAGTATWSALASSSGTRKSIRRSRPLPGKRSWKHGSGCRSASRSWAHIASSPAA